MILIATKSNRSCPKCDRVGSFVDTPGVQWGLCDYCDVRWRILNDRFAPSPPDLMISEKALSGYREVLPNKRIPRVAAAVLSARELSEGFGVDRSALSRFLRGKRSIAFDTLDQLDEILKLRLDR
jgi:DNA-binding Xre family transcriptional regulator